MDLWLAAALDYIPRWIEFQMRLTEQPGCVIAVNHAGKTVLEAAFGYADLATSTPLTTEHRFRVASHSKSFTAAGIMKLREAGKLRLDDHVGHFVAGLHPEVQAATLGQLLSHTGGIFRDGTDSSYWSDWQAFPSEAALRQDLAAAPVIEPNTRFKYSNHGFGLLGLATEAITGEAYGTWIKREIVDAAELEQTEPDVTPPSAPLLAAGHSGRLPLGRRAVFPGNQSTHALAPAAGFVSSAGDLARFFQQLCPRSQRSPISADSRREMIRPQWRNPHARLERWYGLGIMSGKTDAWEWFGHSGAFQGTLTSTCAVPDHDLAVAVLTNAVDGLAQPWLEGILHILARFAEDGAPAEALADWTGRWWNMWGATELVPVGQRVLLAAPSLLKPLESVSEVEITGRDHGRIALAGGLRSHGEPVRRALADDGQVREVWIAGGRLVPEADIAEEMVRKYRRAPG